MAQMSKAGDLTSGPMLQKIILFSLPLAASSFLQLLFNAADVVVVGRFVGSAALAAVGSNGALINLLVNLFVGLSLGANVVAARCFGAKDDEGVRNTVQTSVTLGLVSGFLLAVVGFFAARVLLELMSCPEDVIGLSTLYLKIYFIGMPMTMLYNFSSALLRAVGDTRRPLFCLAVAGLINVVLNLVFVILFSMSVAGVALATIISQTVSACMVTALLVKEKGPLHLDLGHLGFHAGALGQILRIGLPAAIQTSVISFSNVFVQAYINEFQSSCMAGWTSYNRLDAFAWLPMLCLGMANTTFVGQNLGAGKLDRVKKGVNIGILIAMAGTLIIVVPLMCFSDTMLKLFNSDPEVLRYGRMFVLYMSPFYIPYCATQIYSGALRGAGDSLSPMIVTIASFVVFRQLYLLIGTQFISSPLFVGLSYPAGWIVSTITLFIIYRSGRWEKKLPAHVHMQAA